MTKEGLILKGIGGFYYVETADGVFECKAKGKFRKEGISPLAGDRVTVTIRNDKENKDVYMVALRDDDGTLIGYYEKHEYRNRETVGLYQPKR